jgi:TP901 family phage tail tape measure protein
VAENLKQIIEFQAKGIERLKGQYKDLERRTKGLETSTRGSAGALGGLVAKLGLTTVAMYAVSRAISAVVTVGKEFEANISNVAAISGATGSDLAALEKNAQKLGETTVFTASQVAGLQVEFAKLGFSSQEITGVTADTLALASATGSDLSVAAAIAGQTLRAFGLDVSETSTVTDTMALSFSRSALDMDKFTNSMTYVAPIAKQVGFSVAETTAILGTLANAGISGSMAGTSLRKILLELGNENSKLTKKIGFTVRSTDDLDRAFKKLREDGIGTAEMKELVGQRAISAFNILMEGTETTKELTTALNDSGGAAQEMADVQLDNLQGQMTLLNSATEGLGIALFDLIDGALSVMVTSLTGVTSVMTTLIKDGFNGFIQASEDTSDVLSQTIIKTNEQKFQFEQLSKELLNITKNSDLSNHQIERRNRIQDELQQKYPNYLKNLDVESQGYTEIAREISNARTQLEDYQEQLIQEATAANFRNDIADTVAEIAKLETRLEGFESGTMVDAFLRTQHAISLLKPEIEDAKLKLEELQKAYQKATTATTSYNLVLAPTEEEQKKLNETTTKSGELMTAFSEMGLERASVGIESIGTVMPDLNEKIEKFNARSDASSYTMSALSKNLDQAAASAIFAAGSITSTSDAMGGCKRSSTTRSSCFHSS